MHYTCWKVNDSEVEFILLHICAHAAVLIISPFSYGRKIRYVLTIHSVKLGFCLILDPPSFISVEH